LFFSVNQIPTLFPTFKTKEEINHVQDNPVEFIHLGCSILLPVFKAVVGC
jgi:hypothetical protein